MGCVCEHIDTVPWSAFVEGVSLYVDGAPSDVIEYFVREAAIEFARKTSILTRTMWVDLQNSVQDYRLVPPDDYSVHLIHEVSVHGAKLRPVAYTTTNHMRGDSYYFDPPCGVVIARTPGADATGGMSVRMSVIPSQESCSVDALLLNVYADDIRAGALSRLFLMNTQPWFSTMNGGIWLKRWKSTINQVKIEKAKNHSTGALVLSAPRFI